MFCYKFHFDMIYVLNNLLREIKDPRIHGKTLGGALLKATSFVAILLFRIVAGSC
jgi:hypothetical protein